MAVLILLASPVALPQDSPKLQVVKIVPVAGGLGGPMMGPLRCDEKGNVYFRQWEDSGETFPIRSLAPDGTVRASFAVDAAAAKVPKLKTDDFAVTPDGTVYQFGWSEQQPFLFLFDKDGHYKSKIELDKNLDIYQVAVFPKGELLLAGMEIGTPRNPNQNKPVTEIADSNGKFVKYVTFAEDAKLLARAQSGDPSVSRGAAKIGNLAVSRGMAAVANDGTVYLMRSSSPEVVYVVSAGGEVRDTISVDGRGLTLAAIQVHERTLVVQFWDEGTQNALYKLVSLPGGEELATYEAAPGVGSAFACYNGTQFTFLSQRNGKLIIVQAEPK